MFPQNICQRCGKCDVHLWFLTQRNGLVAQSHCITPQGGWKDIPPQCVSCEASNPSSATGIPLGNERCRTLPVRTKGQAGVCLAVERSVTGGNPDADQILSRFLKQVLMLSYELNCRLRGQDGSVSNGKIMPKRHRSLCQQVQNERKQQTLSLEICLDRRQSFQWVSHNSAHDLGKKH